MNKIWLPLIVVVLSLVSCSKNEQKEDSLFFDIASDHEVFFKTSSGLNFRFEDFDFYDSAAYIFYLKENHAELENLETRYFTFLDQGREIYSGRFWPPVMSSIPSGPFIGSMFSNLPPYVMMIGYIYGTDPDPRNSPDMIDVLRNHGLLHSGLSVTIDNAEINGSSVTVDVTVTNKDVTDLLVLDPSKMGTGLFNYFTTGVYVFTVNNDYLAHSIINSDVPDIEQEWSADWLTRLGHDESLHFTLSYMLSEKITSEECIVKFRFPGLGRQIPIDQLYQADARIWLGDILCSKSVSIQ